MKRHSLLIFFVLALITPGIGPVYAGECFAGMVQELSWTGKAVSGVRLRTTACMEESEVITTVPGGATLNLIGEWDGWYKVKYDGATGWIYGTFIEVVSKTSTGNSIEYASYENKYPSGSTVSPEPVVSEPVISGTLVSRLKGYILLQVESHGESWYLNPTDGKRYYMKDGAIAYEMMRSFGLGITNADLVRLKAGNADLVSRLKGRIVLQVQEHGEAYYIHPVKGTVHYMKDGPAAYELMRYYSLGITNGDLSTIPEAEIPTVKNY